MHSLRARAAVGCIAMAIPLTLLTHTASAEPPQPTHPATTAQAKVPAARPGSQADDRRSARDKALADALGITVDQLKQARETAASQLLKDAVAHGRLTQDQADRLTAARANGTLRETRAEIRKERRAQRVSRR